MIVLGGLWTIFSIRGGIIETGKDIKRLEARTGLMETSIREVEKALNQLAVQDERMNNLDSRLTLLRQDLRLMQQGHGFVLPLPGEIGPGPK